MAAEPGWIWLGSGADCDIRVTAHNVATRHARCRFEPGGRVRIEDLGAPGGTAINEPGLRIAVNYLSPGDTVYLAATPVPAARVFEVLRGQQRTRAAAPPPAAPPASTDAAQLRAERGVTVIGRNPDPMNQQRIVVDSPMASRNHAGLLRTESDEYYIWDLGSTYGTFLDSQRISTSRTRVLPDQIITIAGFRFSLGRQGIVVVAAPAAAGIEIRADGIATEVGNLWKRRLNITDVRLAVAPKTMLALMGVSGSGKTTLLRTLAAQAPPKHGQVLYDEVDIYRHFEQIRASLGYVPQDDILYSQLTVRKALYFSARLRLPVDYSAREISQRVDGIMDRLGIAGQADVAIGSTEKRGISGGQRKRVSLGMELLADPAVILLDEPTSGLSSTDAERVVLTLRQLAREGRTVIVTIHQPSQDVFEMFDMVAVVDNDTVRSTPTPPPQPGRLIFIGPVAECAPYFHTHDTTGSAQRSHGAETIFDAIEGNPNKKTTDWGAAFAASPQYRRFVEEPLARPRPGAVRTVKRVNLPSPFHQFATLLERLWWVKSADPWSMWQLLAVQPLVVALGIGLVSGAIATKSAYAGVEYIPDFLRVGKTLFFAVFTAIWFGCNNTAREIVGEFAVYRRERMVGLSLGAYLGSKLVFFAGVAAVQSVILGGFLIFGTGLEANPAPLMFLLWTSNVCAIAIGLLISSVASRGERAIQIVPLALLPMILFGGGVTRLAEMQSDTARSIANLIPARWAFEASLLLENANRQVSLAAIPSAGATAPIDTKFTIVHHYFASSPHDVARFWICVSVLFGFTVVLIVLTGMSLKVQDVH